MDTSIPDEEQITKLYQEMYGRMVAYASSVLGDRNLAEEVVQDTFCIFCVKAETALQHENPQGWLMRTLQNVIRNMQRHRAAMNRLIMQSLQVENLDELLVYEMWIFSMEIWLPVMIFNCSSWLYWMDVPCWKPRRNTASLWRRAKSESSGLEPI